MTNQVAPAATTAITRMARSASFDTSSSLRPVSASTSTRTGRMKWSGARDEIWAPMITPGTLPMSSEEVSPTSNSPQMRWPMAAARS